MLGSVGVMITYFKVNVNHIKWRTTVMVSYGVYRRCVVSALLDRQCDTAGFDDLDDWREELEDMTVRAVAEKFYACRRAVVQG